MNSQKCSLHGIEPDDGPLLSHTQQVTPVVREQNQNLYCRSPKITYIELLICKVSFLPSYKYLGPAFGRTDFSRIFIFEPPDFSADFLAGFVSSFCGEKCPEKSSRKIPGKSSKIHATKILRHISADWPAQQIPLQNKISREIVFACASVTHGTIASITLT